MRIKYPRAIHFVVCWHFLEKASVNCRSANSLLLSLQRPWFHNYTQLILKWVFTCSLVQCESTLQEALGLSLSGRVTSPLLQHLAPPLSKQHTLSSGSAGVACFHGGDSSPCTAAGGAALDLTRASGWEDPSVTLGRETVVTSSWR